MPKMDKDIGGAIETHLRHARHSMLSHACDEANVYDLFYGHHQDDNIEQIMINLLKGRNADRKIFYGIHSVNVMPSAHELFHEYAMNSSAEGVTGIRFAPTASEEAASPTAEEPETDKTERARRRKVHTHRPLLGLPKKVLLQICEDAKVPYVTDQTNFDPTLTQRNAVRHLRAHHDLPKALQPDRLLPQMAQASLFLVAVELSQAELLNSTIIHSIDFRTGAIVATLPFPRRPSPASSGSAEMTVTADAQLQLVKQILRSVKYLERRDYGHKLTRPGLGGAPLITIFSSAKPVSSFTVSEVLVQFCGVHKSGYNTWRFSRRPLVRDEVFERSFSSANDPTSPLRAVSEWLPIDGRLSVRIICQRHEDFDSYCISYPAEHTLSQLYKSISADNVKRLKKLFSSIRHGDEKVLVLALMKKKESGRTIVAFPTLGVAFAEPSSDGALLSWQVLPQGLDRKILEKADVVYHLDQVYVRDPETGIIRRSTKQPRQ